MCNPKLKYSHTITNDATTLRESGPQPFAPMQQNYLTSGYFAATQSPEIPFSAASNN